MKLQLIRNATMRLEYAGQMFLLDPYFAPKHSLASFAGVSPNPTVELPMPIQEIIKDIDACVVSHLHSDHFDEVAWSHLSKTLELFCHPRDEESIRSKGFEKVIPVADKITWKDITLIPTPAQQGSGKVLGDMGLVSGFVFQATDEPTVYWANDTILYDEVYKTIERYKPDIVITHSCAAMWEDTLIVMDALQTLEVCRMLPKSQVIAVHMEALDHATLDRKTLQSRAQDAGVHNLFIPKDGEILSLPKETL